jgi:hypothetical protein
MSELKVIDQRVGRDVQVAPPRDVTTMDLLRIATSKEVDLDRLEKLMELHRAEQREQARRAYTEAMAAFHLDAPDLVKNKHVQFNTSKGRMDYWHATHDEVTGKIGAALAKHGLSHAWRTKQDAGMIYVTCTLTHALGHSENFELFGSPDDSGLKSPLQAVASTITFLQRYTLLGATGLSTSEQRDADDDAAGGSPDEPVPEGFEKWQADMEAVSDEGIARLTEAWGKSAPAFRRYVVKYHETWWNEVKAGAK